MFFILLSRYSSSTWSVGLTGEPGCWKPWLHWACMLHWQTLSTASRLHSSLLEAQPTLRPLLIWKHNKTQRNTTHTSHIWRSLLLSSTFLSKHWRVVTASVPFSLLCHFFFIRLRMPWCILEPLINCKWSSLQSLLTLQRIFYKVFIQT